MMIHNFSPVLIDLGFFEIRWYSIAYILAIILGWMYAYRIINKTLVVNNFSQINPPEVAHNLDIRIETYT